MNQKLHDYVRSTSFNLSLSRRQTECLLMLHAGGFGLFLQSRIEWNTSAGVTQLINLAQKGLIEKAGDKPWTLTCAGDLVCALLIEAGYEVPKVGVDEEAAV